MTHPTSYTTFLSKLGGLSVAGLKRSHTEPPTQINTADLPCMFPRLPSGEERPITGESMGGWPTLRAELVILVEAWMQSRQKTKFADTLKLMDALSESLRAADFSVGPHNWAIQYQQEFIGDTAYWAIVCRVEATG